MSLTSIFHAFFRTIPLAASTVKQCVSSLKAMQWFPYLQYIHYNTVYSHQIFVLDPLTKFRITYFAQGGVWCLSWL